ncbi:MAG: hypothetical protein Q4F29_09045 [Lachnospiraceae bacterium]|nr:hypothetical protein [Lachnospiraceae bacterium]
MENRNGKRMMAAACRYAYSRFVLNDYMFYEMAAENPEPSASQKAFRETFLALTGRFLNGEYPTAELDALRSRIIREADIITAFVDCFQIYEYVLNRMELRFTADALPAEEDEAVTDEIMRYIVSAKESAEQNSRIREILGQLPLRFTKSKFFALMAQALSVYEGTDQKSLKQVLDMLRSEAMLALPEHMEEGHEEISALLNNLRQGDYKNLDLEGFQKLQSSLTLAEETLSRESSECLTMMDLVNDFYVICLTRPDTLMDSQEEELYHSILNTVWKKLSDGDYSMPEEEMDDALIQMEGRQERYYEQYARYEMTDLDGLLGEERTEADYDTAWKVDRLLSTSSFMSLKREESVSEEGILLSRKAVEELCQPLFDELEVSWKQLPRCVMRSVMAKLLAVMPMFFTTSDEIRQFIGGCLSACTDLPEKAASVELIRSIMESDDAFL